MGRFSFAEAKPQRLKKANRGNSSLRYWRAAMKGCIFTSLSVSLSLPQLDPCHVRHKTTYKGSLRDHITSALVPETRCRSAELYKLPFLGRYFYAKYFIMLLPAQ
ncbi:hypothetical protein H0G86_000629 [Trichoderma simmonsii]|uniref:Uncharacterized protein n=1 Tax=Trichoderma simmonsii TaxID=1491479 RepID=A0A8G0L4P6_9HYPO|nr:hypothetical protein H0G86_000629 [Trichoderma simmonsii]